MSSSANTLPIITNEKPKKSWDTLREDHLLKVNINDPLDNDKSIELFFYAQEKMNMQDYFSSYCWAMSAYLCSNNIAWAKHIEKFIDKELHGKFKDFIINDNLIDLIPLKSVSSNGRNNRQTVANNQNNYCLFNKPNADKQKARKTLESAFLTWNESISLIKKEIQEIQDFQPQALLAFASKLQKKDVVSALYIAETALLFIQNDNLLHDKILQLIKQLSIQLQIINYSSRELEGNTLCKSFHEIGVTEMDCYNFVSAKDLYEHAIELVNDLKSENKIKNKPITLNHFSFTDSDSDSDSDSETNQHKLHI